jgi:hypothetical protein
VASRQRSDGSSFANQRQCVSYAAHGGTLSRASISLADLAHGEANDTFAVDSSGFTPDHAIMLSETSLGPSGAVFSIGTVTTDSSGTFVSGTISETDNFWNLIVAIPTVLRRSMSPRPTERTRPPRRSTFSR